MPGVARAVRAKCRARAALAEAPLSLYVHACVRTYVTFSVRARVLGFRVRSFLCAAPVVQAPFLSMFAFRFPFRSQALRGPSTRGTPRSRHPATLGSNCSGDTPAACRQGSKPAGPCMRYRPPMSSLRNGAILYGIIGQSQREGINITAACVGNIWTSRTCSPGTTTKPSRTGNAG